MRIATAALAAGLTTALAGPVRAPAQNFNYNPVGSRPSARTQGYAGPTNAAAQPAFNYQPVVPYGSQYAFTQSPYRFTSSGFVVDNLVNQQAALMAQQVYQANIDTRRKLFDQLRYEEMMTPTYEERRQADLQQQYYQARNNPPPQAVWSGTAINNLMFLIRQTEAATGVRGPTVPLDPDLVKHISWAGGPNTNSGVAMVQEGSKALRWPVALTSDSFTASREAVNKAVDEAVNGTRLGSPDALRAVNKAQTELAQLREGLFEKRFQVSGPDYIDALGFIRKLGDALDALKQPVAVKVLSTPVTASTAAELLDQVSQKGLKVGAAAPGDETYYNSLYNALNVYDLALTRLTGGLRPVAKEDGKNRFE